MKSPFPQITRSLIASFFIIAIFIAPDSPALTSASTPSVQSANLDGASNQLLEFYYSKGILAAQEFAAAHSIHLSDGMVRVECWFKYGCGPTDVSLAILGKYGAAVASASRRFLLVDVPLDRLASFANELAGVAFLHRPYKIYSDVVSEGLALVGGNMMHGAGITGRNLQVGVIDLGFADWETAQNRGELPGQIEIRNMTNEDMNAGSDHGTACAEIVADFASASRFHLLKIDDAADLENSITYLLQAGIPVASMSLTWFVPQGDYYGGEDDFCGLVNEAADQGLLMVKSAGNYARGHYRADFTEANNDNLHHFGNQTVDVFGTSVARPRNFHAGEVIGASLVWDAFPVTALDYDLELVRLVGEQWQRAAISNTRQNGNQPPAEEIQFAVQQAGAYGLRVIQVNGNPVDFTIFSNYDLADYENTSSLAVPAMAARALTVGAVSQFSWNRDPTPLESYSSRGPTYDGRVKPDLVAPDGVSTWSKGARAFSGTSASTPHGAGVAILIKSVYRDWSGDQIKDYMTSTAIDAGDEGADNLFGAGRLNLTLGVHPEGHVIQVPMDVPSIAYAIQIADSLDTILVQPGRYFENLNTNGKAIVIGSLYLTTGDTGYVDSTVIDGDALGRVFTLNHSETRATQVVGLTLTNGQQTGGNGIYCDAASPTIRRCKIIDNWDATRGGGISIDQGEPLFVECLVSGNHSTDQSGGIDLARTNAIFERCIIRSNSCDIRGGGVHTDGEGAPQFIGCIIENNRAGETGGGFDITTGSNLIADHCVIASNTVTGQTGRGGGVSTSRALPQFKNCTFSANISSGGGAIYLYRNGNVVVTNSILWANSPNEISMSGTLERNQITLSYSDIHNGIDSVQIDSGNGDVQWGVGNINADPLFANADASDYRLSWAHNPTPDETKSPCIDAADPASLRDPDSTRADMGAFYFHQQALNAPNISVEPDTVWFNDLAAGDTLWGNVTINNFGDQPLIVGPVRIVPEDSPFGIAQTADTLEVLSGESSILRLFCFVAELTRPEYEGTLLITSNDPDQAESRVILRAAALGVEREVGEIPLKFGIMGLSPNPFNSTTVIRYELTVQSDVKIVIYDVFGRTAETFPVQQRVSAGRYEVLWDAGRLPAGMYLVRLEVEGKSSIVKAVILK